MADEAAQIYDPSRIYVVNLTLPPASEAELALHPNEYQPGTFSLAASDGTPDGVGSFTTPVDVGIRLKGSASFRSLSGKSAFKIRFSDAGSFRGLKHMTLNNMVEDPSMIHETLAYTAFRGAGVPASRTGYAYVLVNGEDYGVHLNIETPDEVALAKIFGSFDADAQHLYEGEGGADVRPGAAGSFEIDEGRDDDRGDLEALIEAVNSSGSLPWATRVESTADLEEMTRMWATEKYIGQWDGYAGRDGEEWLPNNYYLYGDSSGRFQMMPWGNDESWQMTYRLPFNGRAGLLFNRCLDDETCAAIYRQSVGAVRDAVAGMNLDALAASTAALLAPWQELEQEASSREEHDLGEIENEVAETREFIALRPRDAAEWLGEEARPQSRAGSSSADPGSGQPHHFQTKISARSFRVGRPHVEGGVLRAKVHPWGRGAVTLRVASPRAGRGAVVLCRDRARVKRAGALSLHCPLPASAREQLHRGALEIMVVIRFVPESGKPESVTRRIR